MKWKKLVNFNMKFIIKEKSYKLVGANIPIYDDVFKSDDVVKKVKYGNDEKINGDNVLRYEVVERDGLFHWIIRTDKKKYNGVCRYEYECWDKIGQLKDRSRSL